MMSFRTSNIGCTTRGSIPTEEGSILRAFAADLDRHLWVCRSLSSDKHLGPPKNGEARIVHLARPLRRILRAEWMRQGRPEGERAWIVGAGATNHLKRRFRPVCEAAELDDGAERNFKQLRDTFGSLLVTAGVPLEKVSRQMGHKDTAVTRRHYAKEIGTTEHREPMALEAGEVYADLITHVIEGSEEELGSKQGGVHG